MLPDWDFGGDEAKRRTFIAWALDELDRMHSQTIPGVNPSVMTGADWLAILTTADVKVRRASRGRPGNPFSPLNAMIHDYLLLRGLFAQHWPGRRRRESDRASALQLAVVNNLAVPKGQRFAGRQAQEARDEAVGRLKDELKRGRYSLHVSAGQPRLMNPGRRLAEADIALLSGELRKQTPE